MLSHAILTDEEVRGGKTFVLKLWDAVGVPTHWVETLRGEAARRWYDIYRRSDWDAVRAEGGAVFRHPASEGAAHVALSSGRCIYLETLMVETGELSSAGAGAGLVGAAVATTDCATNARKRFS